MTFTVSYQIKGMDATPTQTATIKFINQCLDRPTQWSHNFIKTPHIVSPSIRIEDYSELRARAHEKYKVRININFKTDTSKSVRIGPIPYKFCGPLSRLQQLQQALSELQNETYDSSIITVAPSASYIVQSSKLRQLLSQIKNVEKDDYATYCIKKKFEQDLGQIADCYINNGYHEAVNKTLQLGYSYCYCSQDMRTIANTIDITWPDQGINPAHEELLFTMKFM